MGLNSGLSPIDIGQSLELACAAAAAAAVAECRLLISMYVLLSFSSSLSLLASTMSSSYGYDDEDCLQCLHGSAALLLPVSGVLCVPTLIGPLRPPSAIPQPRVGDERQCEIYTRFRFADRGKERSKRQ